MDLEKVLDERLKALEKPAGEMSERDMVQTASNEAHKMVSDLSAELDAAALKQIRQMASLKPESQLSAVRETGKGPSCGEKCTFGCSGGCGLVCLISGGTGLAIAALGGTFGGSGAGIATTDVILR